MPFTPGKSGNPAGRRKGQKNASSERIKQIVADILESESLELLSLLDQLSPKDRVFFFTRLAAIILPRPTDNEASTISFQEIKIIPNFLSLEDD